MPLLTPECAAAANQRELLSAIYAGLYELATNPQFSPDDIPDLSAWWQAYDESTITKGGTDLVSAWSDKSGNGNTLLQAVATQQPLWVAGAVNGNAGVTFDGFDNSMQAVFALNQPVSAYCLIRQITWTNSNRLINGAATEALTTFQDTVSPNISLFAGLVAGTNGDLVLNTFAVLRVVLNGAASSIRVNNSAATSGDAGALNPGGITIGANNTQNNFFGHLTMVEMAVYNRVLTAQEDSDITEYLADAGGITL